MAIRVILGLVVMAIFLFLISQIINNPTQILVFGFGSEVLGVITYALFKVNVAAAAGALGTAFLLLPAVYIVLISPYQPSSQSITSVTNWFAWVVQGLPATVIGDVGGMIASAIMGP